jgi:hypothetical protein
MRSPDNRRAVVETMLRVVSVAAMATLAVRFWLGVPGGQLAATASTPTLDSALAAWSRVPPRHATLRASSTPDAKQRDWLQALRRTGSGLAWTAEDTSGSALVVEPAPLGEGLSRLALLGTADQNVLLSDRLGHLDSIRIGQTGAAWVRLRSLGTIRAALGTSSPVTTERDSLVTKPLLLLGSAGWEAKFLAAALEEDGWSVSSRMTVAPGAVVRQGSAATIDTASYGAVIVIDSVSPIDAGVITRFVNEGGGLLASGPGVRHPSLRRLLPRQSSEIAGIPGGLQGPLPRSGLNTRALVAFENNVVFERRNGEVIVSARRVGSGRVVAAGYDDTWRLRMVPSDERAPSAHREWWSSMAGNVVQARLVARGTLPVDEAPYAATVAALGAPLPAGESSDDSSPFPWDVFLAAAGAVALLGEWLSRRLRGVA